MKAALQPTIERKDDSLIIERSVHRDRSRSLWIWIAGAVALVVLLVAVTPIVNPHLDSWAKAYLVRALEQHYKAKVELNTLQVSLYPRIWAKGSGLTVRRYGEEQLPPFIAMKSFSAESDWRAILHAPWQVRLVTINGLEIHVPPRGQTPRAKHLPVLLPDFRIDEIHADGSSLEIQPSKPGKLPVSFKFRRLVLWWVGKDRPLSFDARLSNPAPPGEIQTQGKFGPWRPDEPTLTAVSGRYTFQNADLAVFKGISGTLSSEGQYGGILEQIRVQGWTDIPDFGVGISGKTVHLRTEFNAIVDGSNGDTYLQRLKARFLNSTVVAIGRIEGVPGLQGKTISLQVSASDARMEDLMWLALKQRKPPLSGAVRLYSIFELPPGSEDIVDKLFLKGDFELQSARFEDLNVQHKIDALSRSGRGLQTENDQASVVSNLAGQFQLSRAVMSFPRLSFEVPGGQVLLRGDYGLRSEQLNFRGDLRLQAKLSQTSHGVRSLLLKPIDPLFGEKNAGTVLPIKVEGKRPNPRFGIDFGRLLHRNK